jgi:hypothetical protein
VNLALKLKPEAAKRLPAMIQAVGFAFWQHQELENTTKDYVTIRLRKVRGIGQKRGEEISAKVEGLTFGQALSELIKKKIVTGDLASELQAAKEERNWFFHRGRRDARGSLADEARFSDLMARLDAMAEKARELNTRLGREVVEYVVSSGVSQEFIDREAERSARSWGFE